MKGVWRTEACALLGEGYGVEDIGVMLSVPADDVRSLVKALRASGRLDRVLKEGRP